MNTGACMNNTLHNNEDVGSASKYPGEPPNETPMEARVASGIQIGTLV